MASAVQVLIGLSVAGCGHHSDTDNQPSTNTEVPPLLLGPTVSSNAMTPVSTNASNTNSPGTTNAIKANHPASTDQK